MKLRMNSLMLFSIVMLYCNNNHNTSNIIAKGVVVDSISGHPIPGAKVTLLCWRRMNYGEETYDEVDTLADSNGEFRVSFSEGFKLDVGSIASGYQPNIREFLDLHQTSNMRLALHANTATGLIKNFDYLAVFSRTFKSSMAKPVELYGIDILNGKNTVITDSADISLLENKKQGDRYLMANNKKGGLIPIFDRTKIEDAPLSGYMTRYKLTGEEKGFFVRCRDGKSYGRLKIFASDYSRSAPAPGGYLEDAGIMFHVELQIDGNKFNIPGDFRLDYYMLENI